MTSVYRTLFSRNYSLSSEIPSNSKFLAIRELGAKVSKSLLPIFLLIKKEDADSASRRFESAIDALVSNNGPLWEVYKFGILLSEGKIKNPESMSLSQFRKQFKDDLNKASFLDTILDNLTNIVKEYTATIKETFSDSIDTLARNIKSNINTLEHNILEAGIIDGITKGQSPEFVYVMKITYPGCCKHCARLYNNDDGTPKVFRLSELIKNGWDLHRKPAEYKPVVSTLHYNCRCLLVRVDESWDKDKLFEVRNDAWFSYYSALEAFEQSKLNNYE